MYAQETVKPYSSAVPKGQQVEHMFNKIAHSYDELNHILSLGIDRKWRKSAIRYLQKHSNPSTILDIATGTGDLAILANRMLHPKQITGIDISEKMMEIGQKKIDKLEMSDVIEFKKEDCTNLNFDSNSYDAIISAFALRNFENLDQCLSEMYRVLKPGGLIVVIDLCSPRRFPMKQIFWGYRRIVMPIIGHTISHDNHAYTYLPDSMDAIPQGEDMAKIFSKAGFQDMYYKHLTFQMCMLYSGKKV